LGKRVLLGKKYPRKKQQGSTYRFAQVIFDHWLSITQPSRASFFVTLAIRSHKKADSF
jgi:hypothetical protein